MAKAKAMKRRDELHNERLNRLERKLDDLIQDMPQIIQQAVAGATHNMQSHAGTWKWAMALLLTIVGSLGGFVYQALANHADHQRYHESQSGHPVMMEQYGSLASDIRHMNERLSLLSVAIDSSISKLDEKLQLEIVASVNGSSALDRLVQQQIDQLHDRAVDLQERDAALDRKLQQELSVAGDAIESRLIRLDEKIQLEIGHVKELLSRTET